MKCLWILLITLVICLSASDPDGSVEDLQRSQISVENNNCCAASIAVRFNTSTVLVSLCKREVDSGIRNKSSRLLMLDHVLVSIVAANDSHYRSVRNGCIDYDAEYRVKHGDSIGANMLALRLADDSQLSLQYGEKPLPFNCLLVSNAEAIEYQSGVGGILKVDMSGNFESCRAVSIGYLSTRINKWLETRGVYIASQILEQRSKGIDNCSCPYLVHNNISLTEDADVQSCLSILWDCLHENFGMEALSRNYTVEISTIQQQRRTTGSGAFKRVLPRVGHFLKPVVVPSTVFAANQSTPTADAAINSVSEEYSDVHHEGSTRLFRWWKLRRDSAVTAAKSGMTFQWRKIQ